MEKLREIQNEIQDKLDNMDESKEELYSKREEQIELLDEIIDLLSDTITGIEEYNSQWNGLKSIQ